AADQVRSRHQSDDRQGARPRSAAIAARPRRRGDRMSGGKMKRRDFITLLGGVDIRVIQDLLGHRHIKSTVGYARVAIDMIRQVKSPLELLNMAATAPD